MEKYLAKEMSLEKISAELVDASGTFFLARNNDILTGYAKICMTINQDAPDCNAPLEIERLYVCKSQQGTKTGAALMQHCIDYAIGKNCDFIWLGVWEHNHKALVFYKKWGFEIYGSHQFILGDDVQSDVLMKKVL